MRISFTVPAVPVAQPRQRVAVIAWHAHNYTPTKHPVNAFKAAVQMAFDHAHGLEPLIERTFGWPLEGPIILKLTFVLPRPKSMTWKTKPMPRQYRRSGRGDWDNFAKSVCDSLNKIAYFDDSQICNVQVHVVIAAGDEQPHTEIEISEIE